MSALTFTLLALGVVGFGILFLVRKLAGPATVSQCDPEWISNFSVARYRPMLRLLDEADFKFLATQPGYSRKYIDKLRAERRTIFRAYLRNLVRDFHRLHMAARIVLVYAPSDRPDLAMTLMRQKALFTIAILAVEFRLALHTFGLGSVDVRGLIAALDNMRLNVGDLNAVNASAAA
jgi:hypothetical protein